MHEACVIQSYIIDTRLEVSPIISTAAEAEYWSKRGLYSISISCQAFHVCEVAIPAVLPDQTDPERPFWLVQSPPASSEMVQVLNEQFANTCHFSDNMQPSLVIFIDGYGVLQFHIL